MSYILESFMKKEIENKILNLIALKIAKEASPQQLEQLEQLLTQYPQFRFLHDEVLKPNDTSVSSDRLRAMQAYSTHYVNKILLGRENATVNKKDNSTKPIYSYLKKFAAIAAGITGVVFMMYFLFMKKSVKPSDNPAFNTLITPKASKTITTLPDGTSVVLNADSKIIFNNDFSGATREVTLSGEAYFDVAHNPQKPFIIHTDKADIRVLGTVFNVKYYAEDGIFETSLIKGKVEVSLNDKSHKKIILRPLQKITLVDKKEFINKEEGLTKTKSEDQAGRLMINVTDIEVKNKEISETSWMNDRLVFSNTPLSEIVKELERQYNIKASIENDSVSDYRYTGEYDKLKLQEILQILQLSKRFNYTFQQNRLTIK